MNNVARGMTFGVMAVVAAFIFFLVVLSAVSAMVSGAQGHTVISVHFMSPIGAGVLGFFALAFVGGFLYGARGRSSHAHNY
jgi:hypothetical protein